MTDIKDMTDAELVEAVAREVMGWDVYGDAPSVSGIIYWMGKERLREWSPFADMNDTQLVKDKMREMGYKVKVILYPSGDVTVIIYQDIREVVMVESNTEVRAVLEAALAAKRGEK